MNYIVLLLLLIITYSTQAQDITSDTTQANALYEEAKLLQKKHEYQAVIDILKQSGYLYKKHKQYDRYFYGKNEITVMYRLLLDQESAIELGNQIVDDCIKIYGQGNRFEGIAHSNIGISQTILGNYGAAIKSHQKSLVIFKKLEEKRSLASTYNNLGIVFYYKNEINRALKYYKEYELILLELDDKSGLSSLYNNMGALYYRTGDAEEALEYMNKSLALKLEGNLEKVDWLTIAQRYKNISVLCQSVKQTTRAMEFLEKAEITLDKLNKEDHPYYAKLYSARGAILVDKRQDKEALKYLEMELGILQKNNFDARQLSLVYSNLGSVAATLKQYEKSHEYIDKAIRVIKTMGDEQSDLLITPYKNKGLACLKTNGFEDFLLYSEKALKIAHLQYGKKHPTVAEIYTDIGLQFIKSKQFEKAFEYLDKSLEAIVASEESDLSKIIEKKDYLDMIQFRLHVWTRAQGNFSRYQTTNDKKYLDQAYQELLIVQDCIEIDKETISGNQDKKGLLKRTHLMSADVLKIACAYSELGEETEPIEMSFQVAEKNKSAILLEALRAASNHNFGSLPDTVQQKEDGLKKNIASLEKNIIDAQIEQKRTEAIALKNELFDKKRALEDLYKEITKEYPRYVEFKQGGAVDIKALQDEILDDQTALIEYYITDSASYQFVLTKKSLHLSLLPVSKREIDLKMIQFRRSLSNYKYILKHEKKAYEDYEKTAHWFYEALIKPVAPQLSGFQKLIIVPDNTLGHLPFEAFLVTPPKEEERYQELDYLLHHYTIRYSYSAALLLENQKNRPPKIESSLNVQAFSATYKPTEDGLEKRTLTQQQLRKNLNPLPAAQEELKHLERIFPQGNFYYGNKATETQFKATASQANILHLAMHGILNQNNPIASSLVFTEDGDSLEDNFLYTYEISQMTLPMDLVVLSACETGYGKFEWGEGVMSMARSFMFAGVPSLVVSLWQVNDASTAIIMEGFYENLNLGMPKDVALSTIKKDYLKHAVGMASHPAYWAPFIQLGDAEVMVVTKRKNYWLWGGGLLVLVLMSALFLKKNNK